MFQCFRALYRKQMMPRLYLHHNHHLHCHCISFLAFMVVSLPEVFFGAIEVLVCYVA